MKRLTVLICTHNRASLLARVLASLNAATRPSSGWAINILVAANACTDSTHMDLEAYRSRQSEDGLLPLSWFAELIPGKSFALNAAIARLDADIVALVDDDHRVDLHFLSAVCAAADTYPEATFFCGRILPDWDGSEPHWVHDDGPYKIYPLPVPRQDLGSAPRRVTENTGPLPGGGNLFIRPKLFSRVGNFSTELGPKGHDLGGGEDSAFVVNALRQGEYLQYVPSIVQHHFVDADRLRLAYLLRKAYQRSRSAARVHHEGKDIPRFVWRKLIEYSAQATLPFGWTRLRFYLMRIASTLGELRGFHEAARQARGKLPARHKPSFAWPVVCTLLAALGVGAIHETAPPAYFSSGISATLIAATVLSLALAAKSILNFSQTGPQIRQEVLAHYRRYSLYAFTRLLAFAWLILWIQAAFGVTIYAGISFVLGTTFESTLAVTAGFGSVMAITGLQFLRHLLYLPASLVASSHYRMSRLYPVWQQLTPLRLRLAAGAILGTGLTVALATGIKFANSGSVAGVTGVLSLSLFTITILVWLRPLPYPRPSRTNRQSDRPNVLMIGSDTLRADHVDAIHAPFLSDLAQRGTWFSQCYVPCARTAPSLVSLLTGTWPHRHGIRDNFVPDAETKLSVPSLPDLLKSYGYFTAALSDWCGADMGKFAFGFHYVDLPEDQWNLKFFIRQGPKDLRLFLSLFTHNAFGKTLLPEIYYLGGVPLTDSLGRDTCHLLNRLATQDQPFLLNVFFSTTHPPFGAEYPYYLLHSSPDYSGESKFAMARLTDPWDIIRRQAEPREAFDLDQIINLYDGCVRRFDDEVRRLLAHLEGCDLTDNTIIVIYADHGMDFFEHGTWGQGNSAVGEYSARIPLLIIDPRAPGGGRVPEIVRSIDIAPTLLELLHMPRDQNMDGISLAGAVRGIEQALDLSAFNETGIWLTDMPGMHPKHLRYPNLFELLEVPNKSSGTLAIKKEHLAAVIAAKDRMIRNGPWKLVYQPLTDGPLLQLYNITADPECQKNLSEAHPEIVEQLWAQLQAWMALDLAAGLSPDRTDTIGPFRPHPASEE